MQTTDIRYSRPLVLAYKSQIQPGDQVDLSIVDGVHYWVTVTGTTEDCESDEGAEQCDGCDLVLLLDQPEKGDPASWHTTDDEHVLVRVPIT